MSRKPRGYEFRPGYASRAALLVMVFWAGYALPALKSQEPPAVSPASTGHSPLHPPARQCRPLAPAAGGFPAMNEASLDAPAASLRWAVAAHRARAGSPFLSDPHDVAALSSSGVRRR